MEKIHSRLSGLSRFKETILLNNKNFEFHTHTKTFY